jgi:hypothetical protein
MGLERGDRFAIYRQIQALDPVTDHQQIVYLVGAYEFPFVTQRSLEMALFRTYAVPSIARLLDQTGAFQHAGQKRYDDTALLISMIAENGYDSEAGRAAIRRMNQMHRRYTISDDDYLYVLSTFIFEPIHWNHRLAWRRSTEKERLANYYFWREVGKRMNIKDIPETIEEFERFSTDYEAQHFRPNPYSQRVAAQSIAVFTNWFPAPLRPLVRECIYALLDDGLREAFGFPKASGALRRVLLWGMRARAGLVRWLMPPRTAPFLFTKRPIRSYPGGFQPDRLELVGTPAPEALPASE